MFKTNSDSKPLKGGVSSYHEKKPSDHGIDDKRPNVVSGKTLITTPAHTAPVLPPS